MNAVETRRRYVQPAVRDLDTGRVFSTRELARIPSGVDPAILSKRSYGGAENVRQKRQRKQPFDVGDYLCRPIVRFIPPSINPNMITLMNHLLNWLLLALSVYSSSLIGAVDATSRRRRFWTLLACASVNFVSMVLDCLDGMHARATAQCSKLGELLDHGLDALHVSLVCGGAILAVGLPRGPFALIHILNACIYCAQMIIFHFQRFFLPTSGVEAQILTSALYVVTAVVSCAQSPSASSIASTSTVTGEHPNEQPNGSWTQVVVCAVALVIIVGLNYELVRRFDETMIRKFALFFGVCSLWGALFLCGALSDLQFTLCVAFVSFRIVGCYVLNSLVNKPFSGLDSTILTWWCAHVYAHVAMNDVPASLLYGRLARAFFSDGSDPLACLTIQAILPYLFCAHLAYRNVRQLFAQLKNLNLD